MAGQRTFRVLTLTVGQLKTALSLRIIQRACPMSLRAKINKGVEIVINPMTPNEPFSGRTATLTSKRCILYIYSTNTGTGYFKHGIYSPCFSSKCSLFHNSNVFVSCNFHVLYTGCAKIKNNSVTKRLRAPFPSLTCPSLPTTSYHLYRVSQRNVPDFGRVFRMLNYTDITQNTYIQS